MVGRNDSGGAAARWIRNLRHVARVRRSILRMGTLSFAVLFTADRRASSLVEAFTGVADFGRTARLSRYLLLLSESILPRVFSRSSGLRGQRNKTELQVRDRISFHFAKSASIFFVFRDSFFVFPVEGRLSRVQF